MRENERGIMRSMESEGVVRSEAVIVRARG